MADLDIDDLGNLPEFDEQADTDADYDNKVSLVVEDVEQHDERLEDLEKYGSNWQAFQRLPIVPELYVWKKRAQCVMLCGCGRVIVSTACARKQNTGGGNSNSLDTAETEQRYLGHS